MKRTINLFMLSIAMVLSFMACKNKQQVTRSTSTDPSDSGAATDSMRVLVQLVDGSEDMSQLSTKNDEILILMYAWKDSGDLEPAFFVSQFKMDADHRLQQLSCTMPESMEPSTPILFLLIEQDAETPVEQLDPIIRVQHRHLMRAYEADDYSAISKYLGDEDLLGIRTFDPPPQGKIVSLRFEGVHRMDKYAYVVQMAR